MDAFGPSFSVESSFPAFLLIKIYNYTKTQILELYLNMIYLGSGCNCKNDFVRSFVCSALYVFFLLFFLFFHSLFLSPYHKDYNSSGQ